MRLDILQRMLGQMALEPAQQIDAIIRKYADWRGERLARLRVLVRKADPDIVEEVKWKQHRNPIGGPVWSDDGIVYI